MGVGGRKNHPTGLTARPWLGERLSRGKRGKLNSVIASKFWPKIAQ